MHTCANQDRSQLSTYHDSNQLVLSRPYHIPLQMDTSDRPLCSNASHDILGQAVTPAITQLAMYSSLSSSCSVSKNHWLDLLANTMDVKLVLSPWHSTYGECRKCIRALARLKRSLACAHLRSWGKQLGGEGSQISLVSGACILASITQNSTTINSSSCSRAQIQTIAPG